VRLSPLGRSATNWPVVPVSNDRWIWSIWGNENWQEKQKDTEETCPSVTLSRKNSTWFDPGLNPRYRGGKPANNRLSYGWARVWCVIHILEMLTNSRNFQWHISSMWRIDPTPSSDSLNSGRCCVTPTKHMQAAIEEWCFLYGPRRDRCYPTASWTRLYNNTELCFLCGP
jgi:hypothetical protein